MTEFTLTRADLLRLLPHRDRLAHKGNFGRVLILGGSVGYTGAPRLAANAALRCGSGLIHVGVPDAVYPIVATGLTEPMPFPLPSDGKRLVSQALEEILPLLQRCDACLLGVGMGTSAQTQALVLELLHHSKIPLVVDADGINVLSGHIDVLRETACPVILTPHDGEFARLGGQMDAARLDATAQLARETGKIILRKGHRTVITDGHRFCINHTGNPGMATGGSGDVLGGILVSLLGQGLPPLEAAAAGAFIHGLAGDLCAETIGEYGMTPSDMIQAVAQILREH